MSPARRVTSSRRGHVTLSCRLLCLDQSDHRRLGRALLSLAVGLLGASRIEAGIDPKGEWMLPWWRQLGFMPQGSLAVLDDMHKLQGARPREPLAAQAGAHQGGAPEAVGAASHGLVVADPRVLEIQRAFDGVRRTQAANRHWQGRASPLMPANFGPGAVATSVPTSGPGSGAAGTSESQTLRGAKRIKLEEHAFCVYVRRSECAGAGTHVVKVPAQAVLPPNFERWFDPAANVGKRVRDSTQRCRGCGEKFKATLDYAVDIDLDAEIFHS
jgi:hypothetical protein